MAHTDDLTSKKQHYPDADSLTHWLNEDPKTQNVHTHSMRFLGVVPLHSSRVEYESDSAHSLLSCPHSWSTDNEVSLEKCGPE